MPPNQVNLQLQSGRQVRECAAGNAARRSIVGGIAAGEERNTQMAAEEEPEISYRSLC